MENLEEFDLRFTGDFSLAESVALAARSAFVDSVCEVEEGSDASFLDLSFPVEGAWGAVGVRVIETEGELRCVVSANPEKIPAVLIQKQLERMLSLDTDGSDYKQISSRDKVVSELVDRHSGIRPVLFPSPYEAAARAIVGHGLSSRQAATLHSRLAFEYGEAVEVSGRKMHAFLSPDRLSVLQTTRGLADMKIDQLRALGSAAAEGYLDTAVLRPMTRDEVTQHLLKLPGIGLFSVELILIRGIGDPDAFPRQERRLQRTMAVAYDLGDSPDIDLLEQIADNWKPYRSWIGNILRNFARIE